MKHFLLLLVSLPGLLAAQTIEGAWQGTFTPLNQNREIRFAFKIEKNGAAYQGRFYNLTAGRQSNVGAITLQGNTVKIEIPGNGVSYEGRLEADGNSITGTMTQGTNPFSLPLKRATTETAWELPPPPVPPKGLPEGTKLEFEVATIKPSGTAQQGHGFNVTARELLARNTSLADLITFAYGLHPSQVSGLAGWAETERYDIVALLPRGGEPTDPQLLTMLQNLIQSRFNLVFHREKRELSVYAIRIGKGGPAGVKMVKNDTSGVGVSPQGLGRISFRGTTMANLASTLQLRVLDRPVVDQSGTTDRFDFTLNWTPDEFQFPAASAAQRSAAAAGADSLPDLFTAIQEQLGMKLESAKAALDVLVVDGVSRPSDN